MPTEYAETGGALLADLACFLSEVHATALAARESGAMLPPFLHETAEERRASVTSESSGPPVPVDMMTAHFPTAARRQWWERLGFHSREAIGFLSFFFSASLPSLPSSVSSPCVFWRCRCG